MRKDYRSVTPTLPEVIQSFIDAALIDLNVCLPAEVVDYNSKTQKASVQPYLMSRSEDGPLFNLPVIPNVPVIHPRTKQAYVHLPLKKGDTVTLIFSQRSLDNWKQKGGFVDPADRRRFNLSDAFAIPGGYSDPDAFSPKDPNAIEINNNGNLIQVKDNGTVNVGSDSPSKSAALGEAVQSRLSAIESWIASFPTQFAAHVHTSAAPGSPTSPPVAPLTPFTADSSVVASQNVKVVP